MPAHAQGAALDVVEAGDEQRDRRLARARRADHRERLAGPHRERDPVEHGLAARVAEADVVELEADRPGGQGGGPRGIDDVGLGVDELVDALDAGPGELPGDDEAGHHPRRRDERRDVGGEGQEGPDRDLAGEGERAAEGEHHELPDGRERGERGRQPCGEPRRAQAVAVELTRDAGQPGRLALLLPEALDDADPGDGLLDALRDLGRALLGRPRRREEAPAHHQGERERDRQGDQRDDGEQRREPRHDHHGDDDLRDRAHRVRHHPEQALDLLEVGVRARDDLAGAQRVLPRAVEPRDRAEHPASQVVLHRQREPAPEVAAQERHRELHQRERDDPRDDRLEPRRGPAHRPVDRHGHEQRPDRLQPHPEGRGADGGDREAAVAPAVAPEAADPATPGVVRATGLGSGLPVGVGGRVRGDGGLGGGGVGHGVQARSTPRHPARRRTASPDTRGHPVVTPGWRRGGISA